jgi:chaperonin GroES
MAQSLAVKSIKSLMPLLDRVLVQRVKAEAKTVGGIFLPESSVKELNEAKVLAVGPGGVDKEGRRIEMSVKPGDKVVIPQYGGSSIKVGDDEYHILRDHEYVLSSPSSKWELTFLLGSSRRSTSRWQTAHSQPEGFVEPYISSYVNIPHPHWHH